MLRRQPTQISLTADDIALYERNAHQRAILRAQQEQASSESRSQQNQQSFITVTEQSFSQKSAQHGAPTEDAPPGLMELEARLEEGERANGRAGQRLRERQIRERIMGRTGA
ncbi:hypothetical protein MMC25_000157 [Agyrium rufum]|nr:hypothetical protein [Agyrium rufum]